MIFIANDHYYKMYSGNKLSFAFFFCFFVWAFIFIAPFFLAFTTRSKFYEIIYLSYINKKDFWPTSEFYYEQPSVSLISDVVIMAQSEDGNYFYSNIDKINRKIQNSGMFSPIIKVHFPIFYKKIPKFSNIDENNDDLPDRITFKATMNVNASSLRNINVFLFFNYGFRVNLYFLS